MRRPSANRDQALIMFLLDTGVRASELCSLLIGDVDLKTGQVNIKHGVTLSIVSMVMILRRLYF